jgi:hypothetical protein
MTPLHRRHRADVASEMCGRHKVTYLTQRSFEPLASPTFGVCGVTGHDGRHLDQQNESRCRENWRRGYEAALNGKALVCDSDEKTSAWRLGYRDGRAMRLKLRVKQSKLASRRVRHRRLV